MINLKNKKAKEVVSKLRKKFIYVKGPYKKPWDNCICITVGPKKLMESFLSILKISLIVKKKVLVTGGLGFIGSEICKNLLKQNYEVVILDNFYSNTKKNS